MSDKSDKHVRFYFGVSISCLIPPKPYGEPDGLFGWEEGYLHGVRSDLEAKLSEGGFEVGYKKYAPIDGARRLYAADFAVSALHKFPATQVFTRRKDSKFSVRKRPFRKAIAILEKKITDLLKRDYVVNAVTSQYAASRSFIFEVRLGGMLKLKRVITSREISDADGSVSEAIENFNNEVVESLEEANCEVFPETTGRRPKDNIYKYGLASEICFAFDENDVVGELALMEKDTSDDEVRMLGIEIDHDILEDTISSQRDHLESHCSSLLPSKAVLTQFSFGIGDHYYDQEYVEWYDELA